MDTKQKVIWGITIFTVLFFMACTVLLAFAITPLVNTKAVKTRLIRTIEDRFDTPVLMGRIQFSLHPVPGISVTDIGVELNEQTRLKIKTLEIDLDLNRLFKLQPAAARIRILYPELIQSETGPLSGRKTQGAHGNFLSLLPEIRSRLLALVPAAGDTIEIIISNARSFYFKSMDSRLCLSRDTDAIDFQAKITGVRVNFDQFFMLNDAVRDRITGVDAKELHLSCFHDKDTELSCKLDICAPKILLSAPDSRGLEAEKLQLEFFWADQLLHARLIPCDVTFPKGHVGINFSRNSENNTSQIKFTGDDIDISQAREVCSSLLKGVTISDTLFDILKSGTASHITVGFKGNELNHLFTAENLVLQGIAHSATVKIPQVPVVVTNTSGWAKMEQGILSIFPQSGHVGNSVVSGGTLNLNLLHHHINFSGSFPIKVDLSELPGALMRILPGTKLARELSKISQISGKADAMLELYRDQKLHIPEVKITATNIKADGSYQRIPLPLQVYGGNFFLDHDTVTLKNLSGRIGNSKISNLDATVEINDPVPMTIQNMTGNIILEEIQPLVDMFPGAKEMLSIVHKCSGHLGVSHLQVQGPMFKPLQWRVDMAGQVQNAALIFKNNSSGITEMSGRVQATSTALGLSDISCKINDLYFLDNTISKQYTQSIDLPLSLSNGRLNIEKNNCLIEACLQPPSGALIWFEADGPVLSELKPSKLRITDGKLSNADIVFHHNPDMPRLRFSGKLDTTTLDNLLIRNSLLHKNLLKVTGNNSLNIFTDQNSFITIKAQKLNLDPLISPRNKPATGDRVRPWTEQKQIFFEIDELNFSNHLFHDVLAKASAYQSTTRIDIKEALYCGLDFSGEISIDHAAHEQGVSTHFFFETKTQNDVSTTFGCLTGTQSVIEGVYNLKGELSGTADTLEQVKYKQNGYLNFQARSGRIYKATVLSRLLSVLNILREPDLQQQGFGFKTFTAQTEVKDSVIHLKKAFIDADNMAIIADGWAAPLNDALDVTFLVAPFKTLDIIIQHIPIVNTILKGNLVSFPAQANGKISNPTVIPLHPSAVGKGLLNLLEDLVKAPARLMEGVDQNDKKP